MVTDRTKLDPFCSAGFNMHDMQRLKTHGRFRELRKFYIVNYKDSTHDYIKIMPFVSRLSMKKIIIVITNFQGMFHESSYF
jgi:hypothetical protein